MVIPILLIISNLFDKKSEDLESQKVVTPFHIDLTWFLSFITKL